MANPDGTPIWYELGAGDPDAAKLFYEAVAPWTVEPSPAGSPVDYRMIDTGDGHVGGLARHDPDVAPAAMLPGWRIYFGVDDVDASAAAITAAGGTIHLAPFDLTGIGRMAYVADPQGNAFYIMRGAADGNSTAFARHDGMGKACWNELVTSDAVAGNAFYAQVFGWTYPDRMTMPGDGGDYSLIEGAGRRLGATMKGQPGQPSGWQCYFRVADIGRAAETVRAAGGQIFIGPMDVPGGERMVFGCDAAMTPVGFAATGETQ